MACVWSAGEAQKQALLIVDHRSTEIRTNTVCTVLISARYTVSSGVAPQGLASYRRFDDYINRLLPAA